MSSREDSGRQRARKPGRPPGPIVGQGLQQDLARELTQLLDSAGLSRRALAQRLSMGHSTVAEIFAGTRWPSEPVLAAVLRGLDVPDAEDWLDRWYRIRRAPEERAAARTDGPARLVGRADEMNRMQEVVADAAAGRSTVLVVRGEPGVGKTALLNSVRPPSGMAVLTVRCVESESELAFSALSGLLRPVVHRIDRLPAPQRSALAVSLALAELPPGAAAPSRIAIGLGTLELLTASAPALVVLDDVQWMDEASAAALTFAVRHLHGEGLAVFAAVRTGVPCPLDLSGHRILEPVGLTREDCEELANRFHGPRLGPDQLDWLMRHTGGNPLAVVELSRRGLPATAADRAELPPALPQVLAEAYRHRLAGLSDATRRSLLVCAASYTADLAEASAALGPSGLRELQAAEAAELITVTDGHVEFAHPLIRAAVYETASADDRRGAHALLARIHSVHGAASAAQRAWHLADAAIGTDEEAARALVGIAEQARHQGALGAARAAYRRAAGLTARPDDHARHLVAAATCAQLAGLFQEALPLLTQARSRTADPAVIAEIQHVRQQIRQIRNGPREVFVELTEAAEALREQAPQAAADLLAAAAACGLMGGFSLEAGAAAEEGLRLARSALGGPTPATTVLSSAARLITGDTGAAAAALPQVRELLLTSDPLAHGAEVTGFGCLYLMYLDEHVALRRVIERGTRRARNADAVERLPYYASALAELELRQGRWNAAYAAAAHCVALGTELGQTVLTGYALSTLARVEAAQGNRQRCEEYADQGLALLEPTGYRQVTPYLQLALAELDLAEERHAEAATRFTALREWARACGVRSPAVIPFHTDLVEACLRANRHEEAAEALAWFAAEVDPAAPPSVHAALARAEALLTRDPAEMRKRFEAALGLCARSPDRYGYARTLLAYARRLRGAGHGAEADAHQGAALRLFRSLRATPWILQAANGLGAAGPRTRPQDRYNGLTTPEIQVARTIARGATDRETADSLLMSVRTVESHLARALTGSGLTSRSELIRALADPAPHPLR